MPIANFNTETYDLEMQLHPDVARFAGLLRRIEEHLAKYEAVHWATLVRRCRASVEKDDAWGLHHFLTLFGGMGSLNDLVLHLDGKMLATENDQLRTMLGEAWALGTKLQREEAASQRACPPSSAK